ncbi:amino acid adenylation domain-containing protein [Streptomyces sp. SKN60]|uniref:non-ribosomal peptide synthetase n=1 Tax=Streptomyces sp. SKN60 TaxID=2855506 RepID=UPI00224772A8|nr:amino acid adenylation domain-containing protein [Streptomyces sp. SKN60]MCX2182267.1 amino acid adenylation domain-containing protein [Streptomyces sp. SKN60]
MSDDLTEAFGTSPQQEQVWRDAVSRDGLAAAVTAVVELTGPLDVERLRRAAQQLVERYEILRTDLRIPDGYVAPVQAISPDARLEFEVRDVADLAAVRADQVWSAEPVLRSRPLALRVLRVDAERHALVLTASAATLDRAGATVLIGELAGAYAADGAAAASDDEGPMQYADLAEWLRERVGDGKFEIQQCLRGIDDGTAPLGLPFELPVATGAATSTPGSLFAVTDVSGVLPQDVTELLTTLGCSLRDLLLAAWQVALHRYTSADNLLTGLLDSGRGLPELTDILGPLARLLPFQVSIAEDTTFRTVVAACHTAFESGTSESDLFDPAWWSARPAGTVAAFDHTAVGPSRMAADVRFSTLAVHGIPSGAGLSLVVDQSGLAEARVALAYDTTRFTAEDVAQLATVLRTVLAVEDADTPVGGLRIWPDPEQASLAERDDIRLVPSRFADHVSQTPDATAVEDATGALTYAQVDGFAARLAARLTSAGVGPGAVVPVLLERGASTIAAMLGVWRAGAAFTVLDDTTPSGRIAAILADTEAQVVVTSAALDGLLADSAVDRIVLDDLTDDVQGTVFETAPDTLAYVVYTSGSTGTPKGVAVSHAALASYVHDVGHRLPGSQSSSFAAITTFAADLGYTAVFSALASGGRLSVIPKSATTDAVELAAWLTDHAIDCLKIVPSHLAALLSASDDPAGVLPRKLLVVGGEACPLDLIERVAALAPDCVVVNHYGPTETTVGICTFPAGSAPLDPRVRTVPIGTPLPGIRAAVWDSARRPVPAWMPGELYVSGAQVAEGYLNQPEMTAERFVTAPATPGGEPLRWYRTGDVVRALPGGELEYLGRTDHQVKINGYRVEPQEVEAVLRTHAGVRECLVAVTGADNQLTAFVAADEDTVPITELTEHVRAFLPEHMIPKAFVVLTALPRTENGKIDRTALAALDVAANRARDAVPPRDSLELQVLEIWRAMLGSDQFGVTDNFFQVGGHSLLALQLLAEITRKLGSRLPISVLFESGTVEGLARAIRAQDGWQPTAIVPIRPGGSKPPVFCVHAGGGSVMGYLDLARSLPADVPVYGLESVGLDGRATPLDRVQDMAERYAAEIARLLDAEADGKAGDTSSCTVIGWGLGAVFAYAVSEQLRTLGRPVAALVVVDGAAPDAQALRAVLDGTSADEYYSGMTDEFVIERFAAHYGLSVADEDLAGRSDAEKQDVLAAAMREQNVLASDAGAGHLETLFDLYRRNIAACKEYVLGFQPAVSDYDLLLLRTSDDTAGPEQDDVLGWRELFGDRCTLAWFPGDHYEVMKPPIVGTLAPLIEKAMASTS